ncbi:anhydro-N-acetylmuramic acid kinase AnmK [Pontibacillus litoralis]|uniref:Anhydro-N-acetylmuramic acid kinase n=1 Tax=Pontibacillus litoralis JSM 072002 TaxID=1385512 RepID=A0A0A5FXW2_9BACI|nr:anhydro-N-acetylmuramic acid kinase AnmK [Pontibacillus litoralis]KGX84629.1 anhydro-N-acetylmuramic acid kinase [Pontibacillus litoralis JSM 072002]
MKVAGIMSGTSLDGIDVAIIEINESNLTSPNCLYFATYPFEEEVKQRIHDAMSDTSTTPALYSSLHMELGFIFGRCVVKACKEANIPLDELELVGSHGQTVYHLPNPTPSQYLSTLQLGSPAPIAHLTRVPVISDFRSMDMVVGGEGAPLVPYVDHLLYKHEQLNRALQNIGGIGNVTIVSSDNDSEIIAFDTGPGNMIIDRVCERLLAQSYDKNGEWAAKGKVDYQQVNEWLSDDYFLKNPPKSTGREKYGISFTDQWLSERRNSNPEDLIATATYFTAKSIEQSLRMHVLPKAKVDELIISGGGSYNHTLIKMIQQLLPEINVITQEDIGYSSEAKEAIAFAILAYQTFHKRPSNVPSVTRAEKAVILGSVTYPTP